MSSVSIKPVRVSIRSRSFSKRFWHILPRIAAALAVLVVIAGLTGFVVVQSGWFHEYVRQRIISELARATGGRVEIGRFSFRGPTLTATVAPLILHGREGSDQQPLLRVESVTLGLRVISWSARKIDLASLKLDRPRMRIVIDPDGTNNLPGRSGNWPEQMIDLGVGHYEVSNGVIEIDERSVPINLRGDGLDIKLSYDPKTPSYGGELKSRLFRLVAAGIPPLELGVSSRFALEKKRIVVSALRVTAGGTSHADFKGELNNPLLPDGTLQVEAAGSLRDAVSLFPALQPELAPVGTATFSGTMRISFADLSDFALSGRLTARGAGYSNGSLHVEGANVRAQIGLTASSLNARSFDADALGAHFAGSAAIEGWRQVHAEGTVDGLSVAQAAAMVIKRQIPWQGTISGSFVADSTLGEPATLARANLAIAPEPQERRSASIEGRINALYDQREGELSLTDSYVATPSTRIDASGAVSRRMAVQFRSNDLADVIAALPLMEENAPTDLPLKLNNGSVNGSGTLTGGLGDPRFRGQVTIVNASVEGHGFDKFDADVDLTRDVLSASRFTFDRGAVEASGSATLTANPKPAEPDFDNAQIAAQFDLRNANVEELTKEAGLGIPVKGIASAAVRVSGSLRDPQANLTLNIANPRAFGEAVDRVTATLKVTRDSVEVSDGLATDGPGAATFSGSFRSSSSDWKSGDVQGQVSTRNLPVGRVEALAELGPGVDAILSGTITGQARVTNGVFALTTATGDFSAQGVSFRGESLGAITVTGETARDQISMNLRGDLRGVAFEGSGSWRLNGDQNGSGNIKFARMGLDDLHRLAMLTGAAPHQDQPDLPLEGFVDGGTVALTLPLSRPKDFQATVTLNAIQLNPKAGQTIGLGLQPQDVALTSGQPVVVALNSREARIQQAHLTGRDTNLEISGTIPFSASTAGANLTVRGTVNLSALQLLNANLLARGNATVEAALRGSLADPSLNGRMDLKGASVYVKDVTTGLDNVTGGVLFNRTRATIDKVTAQLGTGTLALGGFVEFGSPLIYRLQAAAEQVRVRLPIDLSTTISANLALNGTSDASTLSGSLTLNRAAFNPSTDLGDLFEAFASPVPESASSDYLRGMRFNVRVSSAPSFQLQTSLTRDVQSDVDLTLRGTPLQPVLLGSVSVDSGQVQVFGNQYTINRGDIRFSNPVKIEPVFDLALETKVSGVSVNVSFTGTMDKLKTNYSSDPPLESSKIIALLATGRNPSQAEDATAAQASGTSPNLTGAGGSLLSQALSAQLSSKLQRFFGASRVKIDPTDPATASMVDTAPQARLTFEQQVSKEVTMTYITNLNYTAEQIVRLQWDFNRNWSAIAVRDANGLFGIDFQYRKRFK